MYEILPQDIKRQERKELKKIDKFEAKNSLSLHYSRVHPNCLFYIESYGSVHNRTRKINNIDVINNEKLERFWRENSFFIFNEFKKKWMI